MIRTLQWVRAYFCPESKKSFTCICLIFIGLSLIFIPQTGKAQQLLDKTVTINVTQERMADVLQKITKIADVKFSFSGNNVANTGLVSINAKNEKLSSVLDRILKPAGLQYTLVDRTLVITPVSRDQKKNDAFYVTGLVSDEKGAPVPGATVKIKDATGGVITAVNGTYRIRVSDEHNVLMFSFIGLISAEETVGDRRIINVVLKDSPTNLNEVVVTGYGDAVSRKDLVGSVGKVNMTDLAKAPVVSFDQALAGRVAGVQVSSVDGQPGSAINIVIRGSTSITQDNSPLYVIDGFPIENNDNNTINPQDIESIDVLKDAASTSIYGARGSNGVIMITTKRGKAGKPTINYDGYYGDQSINKEIPVLSPYEFVKLQFEIDSNYTKSNYLANGKTIDSYKDEAGIDWQAKIFHNAPFQNHNLSLSGGDAKTKYSISGSIADQDGILVNSGFLRYQGRVTLDQQVNNKLKAGITANYSNAKSYGTIVTNNNSLPSAAYMYWVWSYRPTQGNVAGTNIEDELFDPSINANTDYRVNPLIQAQNELRQSLSESLLANAYAEYNFTPHLKLRVTGGVNRYNGQAVYFYNTQTRQGSPLNPQSPGVNGGRVFSGITNLSNENMLIYNRQFGDHSLDVVVDYSQQKNTNYTSGADAVQVPNPSLGISGLDEGTPRTIYATSSAWALQSVLGRVNYRYKSKYALSASLRTDGSSKFAAQNRWAYFSSLGLSYRLIEESFMKQFKFLSDAKLRVNYGNVGNNRVSDFASLSAITFPVGFYYSFGNTTPIVGGGPTTLGNPALKWETTHEFDAGMDLGFFNNRITLTADYYRKVTDGLLLNAQLPYMTGYTSAFENIGKVSNSGLELAVSTINVSTGKFNWTTSFNISFNQNKVLALTQGQESITTSVGGLYNTVPAWIAKIGKPIAMFYGAVSDGLYQYSDFNKQANGTYVLKPEVPGNGSARNLIQPGMLKFKDINGDGTVSASDFTIIGDPNPDFIGGITNNFAYKGFDLSVFLQYSYGNDILNVNRIMLEGGYTVNLNTNMYATYANRWSPTNTNTNIPARTALTPPAYYASDKVEDGSYIRLKTVSLGYTFPAKMLAFAGVKKLRIYSSAQNLYTLTNYSGPDPEVSTRNSTLTPGFDFSAYPRAKTIIFGVNVTF